MPLFSNLNRIFDVKIYNDDWIKLVDTQDFYNSSNVEETELSDSIKIKKLDYF